MEISYGFIETLDIEDVLELFIDDFKPKIDIIITYINENNLDSKLDIVVEIINDEKPSLFLSKN